MTEIDHRIEEGPRCTLRACLERKQLAVERFVGLHFRLGIQAPALDVDAVEREHRARGRHSGLDHLRKLQLVTGPGLVRCQRPGCRLVREVVKLKHLAGGVGRHARGQDEFAVFPRVAEQPRRTHVRCRLLRVFSGRREADRRGAVGQGDDAVGPDGCFDLRQPFLVERHHLILGDLLFLQLTNDRVVVGVGEAAVLGDQPGGNVHLILKLGEGGQCLRNQLVRRNIHAVLVQVVGVDFRWQPVVGARPRLNIGLHPVVVVGQLPLECGVARLPSLEVALREQLLEAHEQRRGVVDDLLDLAAIGTQKFRVSLNALQRAFLGELRERPVTLGKSGVLVEANK